MSWAIFKRSDCQWWGRCARRGGGRSGSAWPLPVFGAQLFPGLRDIAQLTNTPHARLREPARAKFFSYRLHCRIAQSVRLLRPAVHILPWVRNFESPSRGGNRIPPACSLRRWGLRAMKISASWYGGLCGCCILLPLPRRLRSKAPSNSFSPANVQGGDPRHRPGTNAKTCNITILNRTVRVSSCPVFRLRLDGNGNVAGRNFISLASTKKLQLTSANTRATSEEKANRTA